MNKLNYLDCGVDIDAGNKFVSDIKPLAQQTFNQNVVGSLGGFSGLFNIANLPYNNPVLVSSTDGVGTKILLSEWLDRLDLIGIDLVAMCANDIICCGATPLFFLDYYAVGKLDLEQGHKIIKGIVDGCKQSGMALLGGETAEMKGVYSDNGFDLAGFAVGVVDREKIIDKNTVRVGNALIGIASSGPHSNGYSLINTILEQQVRYTGAVISKNIFDELIAPTKIYVKTILKLIHEIDVYGIAHITGGGLTENVPRILPKGMNATIDLNSWDIPDIFNWIKTTGNISTPEMLRTFNNGVGMVVVVRSDDVSDTLDLLSELGERAFTIGYVTEGLGEPAVFYRK